MQRIDVRIDPRIELRIQRGKGCRTPVCATRNDPVTSGPGDAIRAPTTRPVASEASIAQSHRDPFAARDEGPRPEPGALAAVVVHGFTGAPWDVLPIAEALGAAGIHAHVPLLTGHDRGVEGVAAATLADWRADVAEAARRLYEITQQPVLLVGFSMGGLLVLDMAIRAVVPLAGLVVIAAPLDLPAPARLGASAARLVAELRGRGEAAALGIDKGGGPDISNGVEMPGAERIPLLALSELIDIMDLVRGRLDAVDAPLLVLHSQHDHTASVEDAWELVARAQSRRCRLVIFDEGYHILTRDVTQARIASEVAAFGLGLQQ